MRLKRLSALLLAIALLAGLLPVSAAAAAPVAYSVEGGSVYFDTETGTVTKADSSVTKAELPETISGVAVTAIGERAFEYCASLSAITIPNTVTSIGNYAFNHCKKLFSVSVPASVKTLGDYAFSRCAMLKTVTLHEGLEAVGKRAFSESGITEIVIPKTVTQLGGEVFYSCSSLEKATVAGSVQVIPPDSFANCYALRAVTLGEGITEIGARAFRKAAIASLKLPSTVKTVGKEAFQQCDLSDLTLNEGLESVGQSAFSYTNMTGLTLPSTLRQMEHYAFGNNSKLTWIYIPVGITRATTALQPNNSLTDIYYAGSQIQWKEVAFAQGGVTIHYNSNAVGHSATFKDVPENAWFYATVNAAHKAGLVAGYADGTFNPNASLSWAQAVVFAVRLNQYNNGEKIFSAADQTEVWYQIYVDYAKARGIIDSVPANPNATILRSAAAILFAKVLKEGEVVNNIPNDYFTDVPSEGFMYEAVYKLARAGVCNGKGGGLFAVSDPFTRSEVATIVARMASLAAPAKIS